MNVMSACMYVCSPRARLESRMSEKAIESLVAGVIDDCQSLFGCWQLNEDPLQELSHFSSCTNCVLIA